MTKFHGVTHDFTPTVCDLDFCSSIASTTTSRRAAPSISLFKMSRPQALMSLFKVFREIQRSAATRSLEKPWSNSLAAAILRRFCFAVPGSATPSNLFKIKSTFCIADHFPLNSRMAFVRYDFRKVFLTGALRVDVSPAAAF